MKKWIFFDLDITLIDIKKAQNAAIEDLYNIYKFNKKVDLESFIKKWDDLTDYHYAFYTRKEIEESKQEIEKAIAYRESLLYIEKCKILKPRKTILEEITSSMNK